MAAGFDRNKSTVTTFEGVSQYITKEAVRSTIEELAALTQQSDSTLFISYVDELLDKDPEACFGKGYPNGPKRVDLLRNLAAKVGEPWISFYTAEEIENLLSKSGFFIKENVTLEDLNSFYFGPVGRTLSENEIFKIEHFVIAESLK